VEPDNVLEVFKTVQKKSLISRTEIAKITKESIYRWKVYSTSS